jgi:hypothetical protein
MQYFLETSKRPNLLIMGIKEEEVQALLIEENLLNLMKRETSWYRKFLEHQTDPSYLGCEIKRITL